MRPKGIVKAHGVEVESVATQLGQQFASGAAGAGVLPLGRGTASVAQQTRARNDLIRFFTDYQAAATTDTLKGDLEGGGLRFVKAVVEGPAGNLGLVAQDQAERRRLGLPELNAATIASIRAAIGPALVTQLDATLQRNG